MNAALFDGERQVASNVEDIRRDHRARYEWAARVLPKGSRIVDLGCGVGYGSGMMAWAGHVVTGIDRSAPAIKFAEEYHAASGAAFICEHAGNADALGDFDAAVCFELIEHIEDPLPMLRRVAQIAPVLLCSVPNETIYPFGRGVKFHYRHYTKQQFDDLLNRAGWVVDEWLGQTDTESDVEPGVDGRTLVVRARRIDDVPKASLVLKAAEQSAPRHVVILGLGPSLEAYVDVVKRVGSRHKFADEVWGINAVGDVIQCDRVFHMDDVRVQEVRAAAKPESNIAAMLSWLRTHPGPVYTSREHPDYPGLVAYPIAEVMATIGVEYFNSTAAYAVAFAIYAGVERITLFGCDFTYPNAHDAERGRGNVEFLLGFAKARGIKIGLPDVTALMDACYPRRDRFYGYDTIDVDFVDQEDGTRAIQLTPHDRRLPSAEEIEAKYDHSKHPNPLA